MSLPTPNAPHNYLAFYWWLDEAFTADAIAHWGTHGSLELLPGRERGCRAIPGVTSPSAVMHPACDQRPEGASARE